MGIVLISMRRGISIQIINRHFGAIIVGLKLHYDPDFVVYVTLGVGSDMMSLEWWDKRV